MGKREREQILVMNERKERRERRDYRTVNVRTERMRDGERERLF